MGGEKISFTKGKEPLQAEQGGSLNSLTHNRRWSENCCTKFVSFQAVIFIKPEKVSKTLYELTQEVILT